MVGGHDGKDDGMSRKYFGTDGVRGTANTHPMTAELALKLGAAAGRYFHSDGRNGHRVVIGKDTRLSGYMLENAMVAVSLAEGGDFDSARDVMNEKDIMQDHEK